MAGTRRRKKLQVSHKSHETIVVRWVKWQAGRIEKGEAVVLTKFKQGKVDSGTIFIKPRSVEDSRNEK